MMSVESTLRDLKISREAVPALKIQSNNYKFYSIPKPDGKKRFIEEPVGDLKRVQRALNHLFSEYPFHPACKSICGESIKTNAQPHQQSTFVLKVDISNCYPSTTFPMISQGIIQNPNHKWVLEAMKALPFCLIQGKNGELVLPTGAPTSPALCNIALSPLDYKVSALCENLGYTYTRYIDDMHISTTKGKRDWELIDQVKELIESIGYRCNAKKSKWYTVDQRDNVIVTGLRIGKQNKVPRKLRRKIRAILNEQANLQQPLDDIASGYLAFVKGISREEYNNFIQYYQRRINYAKTY